MSRRFLFLGWWITSIFSAHAQTGGTGVFQILESPLHSRSMAWGGSVLATPLSDVLYACDNPGLLNNSLHNQASGSFGTLLPTVQSGALGYAYTKGLHNFSIHAQYIDFGTQTARDEGGNAYGTIHPNESKFTLGYSYEFKPRLVLGAQTGLAYSVLEPYVANGIFMNLGLHYSTPNDKIQYGFVIKNMGVMLVNYRGAEREPLPFNIQAGVSFKPEHMPIRFHFTAHSLQRWDLTYSQYLISNQMDLNGNPVISKEANFFNKLGRHLNVGTELVLGPHMSVLFGYNHQRRQEMAPEIRQGLTGFSWGLRMKIFGMHLTYASASYFPQQNSNILTLSLIPAFYKKLHAQQPISQQD